MTAGDVMDSAAVLLNDSAKSLYTYAVQLLYLNLAINELAGIYEANNIGYTNKESVDLAVVVGTTVLDFSTTPALPSDLVEIQQVLERIKDSDDTFTPMERVEFLPEYEAGPSLGVYAWQGQQLKFIGATEDREIQIEYVASAIPAATSSSTTIALINSKNFLAFRTAALCAIYIGENEQRAAALNKDADGQLDWLVRISIKGAQNIPARRRPFRARFKARGW